MVPGLHGRREECRLSGRESPPAAIVFDWDNTLVDTWPVIHEALLGTLQAMGHAPWTIEETRQRVRRSVRDAFPELFGDRWTEARRIFYDTFERIHIGRLLPLDDAAELLGALSGAGIHLAVLSNKTGRYLRAEATHLGWTRFFGRLIGAGDACRDKPAPESLELALATAPVGPGPEVWIVGDAGIDLEIAHRTGCVPVLVHRDAAEPEFAAWPPAHCFDGCRALLEYIRRW
ncbi:MAG: HAD family hydrolase [Rhodospirillales bacterium]|nr:MAG: HAD family hydrolase [Rhodospirillales bacterium]